MRYLVKNIPVILPFILLLTLSLPGYAQTLSKDQLILFEDAITKGEGYLQSKDYAKAKAEYQRALSIDPNAKFPKDKLAQIRKVYTDPKDEENFTRAIEAGDKAMTSGDYSQAKDHYQSALIIKPDDQSARQKLASVNKTAIEQEEKQKQFDIAKVDADKLFTDKKYAEALAKYKEASQLIPGNQTVIDKIRESEQIISDIAKEEERYNKILLEADEAYMDRGFELAKQKYNEALSLKPNETYPKNMLTRIEEAVKNQSIATKEEEAKRKEEERLAAQRLEEQRIEEEKLAAQRIEEQRIEEEKLAARIEEDKLAAQRIEEQRIEEDKLAAQKRLEEVEAARQREVERLEAVAMEEKRLADEKRKLEEYELASVADKEYLDAVASANELYMEQDYSSAIKLYEKARELKPMEKFPQEQLNKINNLLAERIKNNLDAYNILIRDGDLAYQSNIFDKALESYNKALAARPEEVYPSTMIEKIKKLLNENSIVELLPGTTSVIDTTEQRFPFKPVDIRFRKNNYLIIKAKKVSDKSPKVIVNYGKDSMKNGGYVMKNFESSETIEYYLRISTQDKWYREDNNWISLYPEGGSLEISSIRISRAENIK